MTAYSDYENRLPRGRTYVRNGSVIDLNVAIGEINAMVSGSSIYKIKISISPITSDKWISLVTECAGKIDSLIELLQGNFLKSIMEIITQPTKGLFPHPKEIKLNCSCPDQCGLKVMNEVAQFDEHSQHHRFKMRNPPVIPALSSVDNTTYRKTVYGTSG